MEDLEDLLCFGEKSDLQKDQNKIVNSFKSMLKIAKTTESDFFRSPKDYLRSKSINNEGYDKFLNDLVFATCSILRLDESSFKSVKASFQQMMKMYKIEEKIVENKQLNEIVKQSIYKSENQELILN